MLIGKRIYGRYKIVEMIGGGGMANVYLAQDMILEREVAIKILRMDFNNDDEFIKRFNREAQAATTLAHPNIVSIYDVGEENDIYFIVMEYVKGLTLKQYIQQHHPIPIEKTLYIMEQVTSAIEHAHHYDIIHRDIKPQNILIDENDIVKITDFGIATALSATTITQTNAVLGSVHYLSPEQARGGMASKKSDIYSLGIVMFELLTGRLPFSGESAVSIALKHLQSTTPSPKRWNSSIPQSVENIVLKATAKDSFHRYESVHEMKEDIKTALAPDRQGEKPFYIPDDIEATKALPIITHDSIAENGDTIILNGNTQEFAEPKQSTARPQQTKVDKGDAKESKQKQKKQKKVKPKKPKKKKRKILVWSLLVLVILGVLAFLFLPDFLEPSDVKVPDVADEKLDDAMSTLVSEGFVVGEVIAIEHEEIEENRVVRTDPKFGKTVKQGATVNLYVSKGKKKTEVLNFVNRDYESYQNLIESQGFKDVILTEEYNDEWDAGVIIRQSPTVDTEVVASETILYLTISKGANQIVLKDLRGYTEKSLNDYEAETGLVIAETEEYNDSVPKGMVISQYPGAGTRVNKGSTVNVVISKGVKEVPPEVVTREVTIRYEPVVEGEEQHVQIYIEDMNESMTELHEELYITEDTTVTLEFTIAPNKKAGYKIMRDDRYILEESIPYSPKNE